MSDSTIGRAGLDSWLTQMGVPALTGGADGSSTSPLGAPGGAQASAAAGQVSAASGTLGVAGATSSQASKFAGGVGPAQLPLATMPRLPASASTRQETLSFLQESQAAVQGGAQYTAGLPGSSKVVPPFNSGPQTQAQAVDQLVKWGVNQAQAVPALARSTLGQFLLLRMQSDEAGVKALQGLANLSHATQGTMIEQEVAQSKVAEEAAKKAAAKAQKLGVFGKIFQAVVAVVSVVLAVCSFGTLSGVAIGLIVAASAAAFVITGAVKGAKSGKGFDFFAALDAFSIAISLGGLGAVLKGAAAAAIKVALENVTKNLAKAAEKVGVKAATEAAEKGAQKGAQVGADDAVAAAARGGATEGSEALTATAQQQKQIAMRAGQTQTSATIAVGEKGSKAAAQVGQQTSEEVVADLVAQLKKALPGSKEFGSKIIKAQVAVAGLSAAEQIGTGAGQYQVANLQADSKEALAVIGVLKALVDQGNNTYKTLNDSVQGLVKSHTDVIDDVNRALHERSQLIQNIGSNFNA